MESEKISKELQSYNKNNLSYFEKINKLIKYQEKLYDMKYKDGNVFKEYLIDSDRIHNPN